VSKTTPPTFILGVGAQKAGTSWLHAYLSKLPEVDLGFMKEYHVFDQKFVADKTPPLRKRIPNWFSSFFPRNNVEQQLQFRRNNSKYVEYFNSLVNSSGAARITGDITPSYAALPASELARISGLLHNAGFKVKVIFLMRDPVERCISANRMYARHLVRANPDNPNLEAEILAQNYMKPRFAVRTRYDRTISNLEDVFSREDIFYGFYEELFSSSSVVRLCEFLELPFREADYGEIVNGAKVKSEIPRSLRMEIRTYYQQVYDLVGSKFGQDVVDRLWHKNK
jgi:hypothetical protein